MKQFNIKLLRPVVLVMITSTSLIACASTKTAEAPVSREEPKVHTQQIQIEKRGGDSQVVWVADGKTDVFQFRAADLKDEKKLAEVLAKLPENQREQIKTMLLSEPHMQWTQTGDQQVFLASESVDGKKDRTTERHIVLKTMPTESDAPAIMNVEVGSDGTQRHVVIKKVSETEFSGKAGYDMFKAWLTKAKLDKQQLQELQKLLDSKH